MAQSADISAASGFLAYVQDYSDELIQRAFFTPKIMGYATPHEGIKGKTTLTRLKVVNGKAVAWASDFVPASGAVTLGPRHIDVTPLKRDLSFCPQEYEKSYLGKMRPRGQNPGKFLPFEADTLMGIMKGHSEEFATALFSAVQAVTVVPGTTPMNQTFNGFLKLIADAITATELTPVVTPTGAITNTNAVALMETMWNLLGAGYKEGEVHIFCSWTTYQKYNQDYRERYGKYTRLKDGAVTLDFSQNAILVPLAEMGNSNRVIMTPGANMHVAFDDLGDQTFEMEQNKRNLDFWMDWKMGVQIGQFDEGAIVVNDLA